VHAATAAKRRTQYTSPTHPTATWELGPRHQMHISQLNSTKVDLVVAAAAAAFRRRESRY